MRSTTTTVFGSAVFALALSISGGTALPAVAAKAARRSPPRASQRIAMPAPRSDRLGYGSEEVDPVPRRVCPQDSAALRQVLQVLRSLGYGSEEVDPVPRRVLFHDSAALRRAL